jgi:hypothetical protein
MAAAGAAMLAICLRWPAPALPARTPPATERIPVVLPIAMLVLLLLPLSIPTSWTREYIAILRHAAPANP